MSYDRTAEDSGNIVEFGHVNMRVPDQRLATLFYVTGLGLTRDPYMMTSVDNMWVNAGVAQFHLPTGPAQVLAGTTILAVPDLDQLAARLKRVAPMLEATSFKFSVGDDAVNVTCPWGNLFRCITGGAMRLGIPAVEVDTAPETADAIVRFYREIIGAPANVVNGHAVIGAGTHTKLIFKAIETAPAPFDGAHIQISLADFSGPHRKLVASGLITEESNQHQYRFQDIIDPATGKVLCTLEHEVRSMRHPMFARPLVNRDPTVTNTRYTPGHEALMFAAQAE